MNKSTDEYPTFNIVGEVWMQNSSQMALLAKDSNRYQNYNSIFHRNGFHTSRRLIKFEDDGSWDKGMIKYDNFTNDYLYADPNNILVFAENHDTNRFNEIYQRYSKYKMAMAVLATVRGIPQLYYGSEIGMSGKGQR
jgi:glycosidase